MTDADASQMLDYLFASVMWSFKPSMSSRAALRQIMLRFSSLQS
jgi:hypothetical protein